TETLLDTIPSPVYYKDAAGRYLGCNRAFEEFWGKRREEVIGKDVYEMGPKEIADKYAEMDQELFEGPGSQMYEWQVQAADGSKKEVIFHKASFLDAGGKVGGLIGVILDITERKRAEESLAAGYEKLKRSWSGIIKALSKTVETRDPYTAGHQQRVAHLAGAISQEMGLSQEQCGGMQVLGLLHDIGKMVVPAEILSKPGKLSEMEINLIKAHPQVGYDILGDLEFHWPIARAVLQHHERLDGSGYPQGLTGPDIILCARILAVADVVEAMASHRPYRPALGIDQALEEISRNRGTLYDPDVVDVCVKLFTEKTFQFD
ncbi:MAG: HD domain-containing phosphohydrolase, partial [Pseudomonadota bacterium]